LEINGGRISTTHVYTHVRDPAKGCSRVIAPSELGRVIGRALAGENSIFSLASTGHRQAGLIGPAGKFSARQISVRAIYGSVNPSPNKARQCLPFIVKAQVASHNLTGSMVFDIT
jgi:hypothetical protein